MSETGNGADPRTPSPAAAAASAARPTRRAVLEIGRAHV